jgi:hypothetical protein
MSKVPFSLNDGFVKKSAGLFNRFLENLKTSKKKLDSIIDKSGNWDCFMNRIYDKYPGSKGKIFWMLPNEFDYLLQIIEKKNIDYSILNEHEISVFERLKKINIEKLVAMFTNGPSLRPKHVEEGCEDCRKTFVEHLVSELKNINYHILLIIPEPFSMFNKDPKMPNKIEHIFDHFEQIFSERLCREMFSIHTNIPLINLFYVPEDNGNLPGNTTQKEIVVNQQSKPVVMYIHPSRIKEWRYSLSYFFNPLGKQYDSMYLTADIDDFFIIISNCLKQLLNEKYGYNDIEIKYNLPTGEYRDNAAEYRAEPLRNIGNTGERNIKSKTV